MAFARSKSAHDEKIISNHKIVVFTSRKSVLLSGIRSVQDLEDFSDLELDESALTRTFSQDDCLHLEQSSLGSPVHGLALHGRASYNFQQGLVNTREVLGMQRWHMHSTMIMLKG